MANYLLVYHGGRMPDTQEEQGKVMAAWGEWFQRLGPDLKDGGNPVGKASIIDASGAVTDGGGPNPTSGYSIITAESLERAVELSKDCPVRLGGGSIEVCETFDVM